MKTLYLLIIPALLLMTSACELSPGEEESSCLPTRLSITLVQGSQTTKIIADFHYLPETGQLGHITWSNHQTHYFEYDSQGRIRVVRALKVDARVQEEKWFTYDGNLVERVDLVTRNLDYTYLEPIDSIHTGYIEYAHEAGNIIEEWEYQFTAGEQPEEYIRNARYDYDSRGNMISSTCLDPVSGESQTTIMSHDQSKHPYFALEYYFLGESYVNNMTSKSEEESGFDYTYELSLNEYGYPETIYEKLGSTYSRISNYSYKLQ